MVKICVPTDGNNGIEDTVSEHFGRAPTYTIIDLETNDVKVIPNTSNHMGGQEHPPELLAREGVQAMICRGLGRRAIQLFQDLRIDVYIGATGQVKDAVEAFKQGILQKADINHACGQHAFRHDHQHEHHHECKHNK